MKKKVEDCTIAELDRICNTSVGCQNCPFSLKDGFGYEECLLANPDYIPNSLLEKEDEVKGDIGIKKIKDITVAEIGRICLTSVACKNCPLVLNNDEMQNEDCLLGFLIGLPSDMLEKEVEIPKETEE